MNRDVIEAPSELKSVLKGAFTQKSQLDEQIASSHVCSGDRQQHFWTE